jgi:hypothetical protein
MDGDPRDPDVEAAEAKLGAQRAELAAAEAAMYDRVREQHASLFRLDETQARRCLEVAAIVFGLTIAFAVPERNVTTGELLALGAAIALLGASIVVGLLVAVDAPVRAAEYQYQMDEQVEAQIDYETLPGVVWMSRAAHAAVTLTVLGIVALAVFALLRLPSAS